MNTSPVYVHVPKGIVRKVCLEVVQEMQADCVTLHVFESEGRVLVYSDPIIEGDDAKQLGFECLQFVAEVIAQRYAGSVGITTKRNPAGAYETVVIVNSDGIGSFRNPVFEVPQLSNEDPARWC